MAEKKKPFHIFPSIGYRNSQFQILSTVDNLRVNIYDQDKLVKSIETNSKFPSLLTSLDATGKLIAKCSLNNEEFQQEIEIKEAFRLGSSEFKKAYVFDDAEYSFFLMKDRLLLYDEKKKTLLTENHYSPTEIHRINKTNYLFITKVGSNSSGITNLGIFNTETFSIVGELLNDYREIIIQPERNNAWLYNIKSKTIHCFELIQSTNRYFTQLENHEGFSDFILNNSSQFIVINYIEKLIISDIKNLLNTIEISKSSNIAIDKSGNIYSIDSDGLTCTKCLTDYYVKLQLTFELNLQTENFIYIGNDLKSKIELTDLNKKVEAIKEDIISSIPENKTEYFHSLSESQRISESLITQVIYPTINGIYILQKEVKRKFDGIKFRKHQTDWIATPYVIESNRFSLTFFSSSKVEKLLVKIPTLTISKYQYPMILVNYQNKSKVFSGSNQFTIENEDTVELITVKDIPYFTIKSKDKFCLFRPTNFKNPILEQIEILNPDLIKEHQIIWYSGKKKDVSNTNYLSAFDLKTCSKILINENKFKHSLFKDADDYEFNKGFALSSNQIVFNPRNLEAKDAFIGVIETYSQNLNKIVSHRANIIYLSVFNAQSRKYELSEIQMDDNKYKESYLAPNGQFLVLYDENNKYVWYDIEKNEIVNFIPGNFLAFRNDGSLIIEQNDTKAVKIFDPKTFQDITPPNYHHYRFVSPDGKLYAQVAAKTRYLNKLNGEEITVNEVRKYKEDLDEPSYLLQNKEREQAKLKVDKNRKYIFETYRGKFDELDLEDYNKINSHSVVKVEQYTEIGILGTNVFIEVLFPEDLAYYNYSAFSYDNKYFAYVGKPSSNGLIHLFKIDFNEANSKLIIADTYISRYPRKASWVCGFSKTGYFATYDSTPDTYILFVDDELFENKAAETELSENIFKSKTNIFHSYGKWNEIKNKNFLCFSPTGDFLALSEQGYEPLTLGGYGHQESNVVHIAKTKTGEIIDSFNGHGDKIKDNKTKKVTFVAFSEDEKRLMTLSSDGVVIIRDIVV